MEQTVSGNIKCFDISCSDEDIEKSVNGPIILTTADIYLRFPEIMEEEANDLADFLEDEQIVYEGATDVFIEKDKEIERLNNIINELEKYIGQEWYCFDNESIEFEVSKNILDKLKELKESGNNG